MIVSERVIELALASKKSKKLTIKKITQDCGISEAKVGHFFYNHFIKKEDAEKICDYLEIDKSLLDKPSERFDKIRMLQKVIADNNIKTRDIAKKININHQYLMHILAGTHNYSDEIFSNIINVLERIKIEEYNKALEDIANIKQLLKGGKERFNLKRGVK